MATPLEALIALKEAIDAIPDRKDIQLVHHMSGIESRTSMQSPYR